MEEHQFAMALELKGERTILATYDVGANAVAASLLSAIGEDQSAYAELRATEMLKPKIDVAAGFVDGELPAWMLCVGHVAP